MTKILVWGTGSRMNKYYKFAKQSGILEDNEIIGFIDNNSKKWGKEGVDNIPILPPYEIKNMQFDYICIWSTYKKEISEQLQREFGMSLEKQRDVLKEHFVNNLRNKYSSTDSMEIKECINNIKNADGIYVYNFSPKFPQKRYEAFYDEAADLYYIYFENKKLYLKRGYPLINKNENKYVENIWYEQDPNSPHLYEDDDIKVCDGDVLVDAGACEGNFSLHHIEHVKKVYLIECNDEWIEALQHTFAPYKDKVVFCNKFLSNFDTENMISLDSLLSGEKISFLKMDIEGEEINALYGAKMTLTTSDNVKCSICSYHRHGDEEKIKKILEDYGMHTYVSKGYMLFLGDEYICKNPELRRGIVRATMF